ncbi:MAG: hypothetical protein NVS9B14_11900 [Candidatus Acidiferrum sp.]
MKIKNPPAEEFGGGVSYKIALEGRLENWHGTLTTKRSGHCRRATVTTRESRGGEVKGHLEQDSENAEERQIGDFDVLNCFLRYVKSGLVN